MRPLIGRVIPAWGGQGMNQPPLALGLLQPGRTLPSTWGWLLGGGCWGLPPTSKIGVFQPSRVSRRLASQISCRPFPGQRPSRSDPPRGLGRKCLAAPPGANSRELSPLETPLTALRLGPKESPPTGLCPAPVWVGEGSPQKATPKTNYLRGDVRTAQNCSWQEPRGGRKQETIKERPGGPRGWLRPWGQRRLS